MCVCICILSKEKKRVEEKNCQFSLIENEYYHMWTKEAETAVTSWLGGNPAYRDASS